MFTSHLSVRFTATKGGKSAECGYIFKTNKCGAGQNGAQNKGRYPRLELLAENELRMFIQTDRQQGFIHASYANNNASFGITITCPSEHG